MPDRFELTIDLIGPLDALAETRVMGIRLGPLSSRGGFRATNEILIPVRIKRDASGLRAWLASEELPTDLVRTSRPTRLDLEGPAGRPLQFRNLVLRWQEP
jgi:hypothetical protein